MKLNKLFIITSLISGMTAENQNLSVQDLQTEVNYSYPGNDDMYTIKYTMIDPDKQDYFAQIYNTITHDIYGQYIIKITGKDAYEIKTIHMESNGNNKNCLNDTNIINLILSKTVHDLQPMRSPEIHFNTQ